MEFPVRSAPLAAYLIAAQKLPLLRIEANTQFATLIFDDPDEAGIELEYRFLSDEALVSAQAYHLALRAVRRKIEIKLAEARKLQGGAR
jgi:hypothetical protein